MDDIIDLLKIKIEKAKRELSLETVNAIDAVDWRTAIIGLRSKYGYTFEQLGDLELETELLLCGLVSGENYPKELENRLKISKAAANELVNEMNDIVFKKIREELIKNTERKKIFTNRVPPLLNKEGNEGRSFDSDPHPTSPLLRGRGNTDDTQILNSAGIEIIPGKLELTGPIESRENILNKIENPETVHPILTQKLSASVQIPTVKTEHSLENITKTAGTSTPQAPKAYPKNSDPYRLPPEN